MRFDSNGLSFVWDEGKARRNEEARNAVIGRDARGRVLFVVHIEIDNKFIRIISARRATREELKHHDS